MIALTDWAEALARMSEQDKDETFDVLAASEFGDHRTGVPL